MTVLSSAAGARWVFSSFRTITCLYVCQDTRDENGNWNFSAWSLKWSLCTNGYSSFLAQFKNISVLGLRSQQFVLKCEYLLAWCFVCSACLSRWLSSAFFFFNKLKTTGEILQDNYLLLVKYSCHLVSVDSTWLKQDDVSVKKILTFQYTTVTFIIEQMVQFQTRLLKPT